MNRPKPIIRLDRIPDQEALVRALYALGFRFNYASSVDDGVASWLGFMGPDPEHSRYPWMTIEDGISGYGAQSHCGEGTLINSPRQFIAYARTLSS